MTVGELIEALSTLDPSLSIVGRGYERGLDDADAVQLVHVELSDDAAEDWAGTWRAADEGHGFPAVFIGTEAWISDPAARDWL